MRICILLINLWLPFATASQTVCHHLHETLGLCTITLFINIKQWSDKLTRLKLIRKKLV